MRTVALPVLIVITAAMTGCEFQYEATIACTSGNTCTYSTGTGCTKDDAVIDARNKCNGTPGGTVTEDSYLVPVGTCGLGSSNRGWAPLPQTARFLQASLSQAFGEPRPEAEEPDCGSPGVTFTVIARNNNQDDDAPCDDSREVRVVYEKYVGEFEAPEEVTLSAVIPAGGSHTFTVTDAYPAEDGSALYFYVIYQLYNFIPGEVCEPIPFEEGGMSRGFSNELREGGTLDITYLPPGSGSTFEYTISNPATTTAADARSHEDGPLQPIPDPNFARGR